MTVKNPLLGLLSWGRRAAVVTVALPLVISLAVMAYAWPASRIAPRDLPVGIVGTSTASQHAIEALAHSKPGGFDFRLYPDEASARSAIENRDVYGAFVVTPASLTVLKASAASVTVAQLLDASGQQLAAHANQVAAARAAASAAPSAAAGATPPAHGGSAKSQAGKRVSGSAAPSAHGGSAKSRAGKTVSGAPVKVGVQSVDVVPISADDPRGVVFSSAVLPLTICSILIAALITMSDFRMPGRRRLVDLVVACAVTGLSAYLVAQGILGALPHQHVATWAALSLTVLAISATTAGLITLIGPGGLGASAALMVFAGNPFSGSTSAPELLPKVVDDIGQWLPPGAGANLLRGTAYFDGNGSGGHIAVLVLWSVLGLAAVAFGGRRTAAAADGSYAQTPFGAGGASDEGPAVSEPATSVRRSAPGAHSESPSPAW
ncbi:ABC transporter permease [Streptomyces sp. NPDC002265]|uniref:ABC transporter permease n=1 Tax=Streptomyces sp. NPDC002265 TaxID=3154415 RepID=UPI00332615BA